MRPGVLSFFARAIVRRASFRNVLPVSLALAVLSACSVTSVMRPDVDVGVQTAAMPRGSGLQRLVPSNPYMAGYPRMSEPAPATLELPEDEVACRKALKRIGVTYRDLAPIDDGPSCGVPYPVEVSTLSGDIQMEPAATLSCQMALTFARWTKNELGPAARWRYLSGVKTIHQASSYSCRAIRTSRARTMSQHASGNALDVARIELDNGRDIDVRKPGWFAFRQRGFLNSVRSDGCDYFNTVLGPGYNADHADHFHFDIAPRRGGRVACH